MIFKVIAHGECNDMILSTMLHLTFPKQPLLNFAEVPELSENAIIVPFFS